MVVDFPQFRHKLANQFGLPDADDLMYALGEQADIVSGGMEATAKILANILRKLLKKIIDSLSANVPSP